MKKRNWVVLLAVIPIVVLVVGVFADALSGCAPVLDVSVLVGR